MNVMILAAGEGTRLRPFTLEKPKPAIPFLTVPLGYFSLSLLDGIKIHNLVVNTYHLPDQILHLFKNTRQSWKDLCFTSEAQGLLGSGGGIHNAKRDLQGRGDFLVLNGDELILPKQLGAIDDLLKFHQWHKGVATLLTMKHPEVGKKFGGAWADSEGKVRCFSKTDPKMDGIQGHHFIGAMILSDRVFKYFKSQVQDENILYETLTSAMNEGEEVYVQDIDCHWFETGNPVDFMHATRFCIDNLKIKDTEYWKEYLKQTVRLYGNNSYLIEKGTPEEPVVQNLVAQIKAGF